MRDRKGFTLVELLLVVAILAFLVAIIVIAATNISQDSKIKSMYTSVKSVKTALETYFIQYGTFPDAQTDFETKLVADPNKRLLDNIPDDIFNPAGGKVQYTRLATDPKRTYLCLSLGPNGTGPELTVGDDSLTGTYVDDIFVTNAKGRVYQP